VSALAPQLDPANLDRRLFLLVNEDGFISHSSHKQGNIAASLVTSSVCSSLALRRLLFVEQWRRPRWKTTARPCPVLDSRWWL